MTMDVSRLGIVVESTGITEARNALAGSNGQGGLAGAAARAEKNVQGLTASLGKMLAVNATGTAQAWNQSLSQLSQTLSALQGSMAGVASSLGQLTPALNAAATATNQINSAHQGYVRSGNVVTNTLKAMTTAATAYAAVNFGMSIVKQADAWQMMTARLQNATGSLNNAKVAQDQMFEISQRLRVPLEDQVKLYTRMAPAMQRLGKSSDDTKNVVEGVATALQLGGANGAEMSSVMLQLSQSFGSGVLNGAEFNAVAENGQVIMKALMEYTGKSQAELKKLGSQGKLSIGTVNDAIMKALPEWRKQFDNLPVTFEGGVQRIKNAWTKAIGEMGQDTGFNRELSKSLRVIEDMIPAVARGLGEAFISVMKWVEENKSKLAQIWDQVVGITKDVWKLGEAFFGLLGHIVGAGQEISVMGLVLFTVRGMLASIVDVVKYIGASFVHVGMDIAEFFLKPLDMGLELGKKLYEGMKWIFEQIAAGAKALGWTSMAEGASKAAKEMDNLAWGVESMRQDIDGIVSKGRAMGDSLEEGFKSGNTELNKFLTGADEISSTFTDITNKARKFDPKAWNANAHPKATVDEKAEKARKDELKHFEDAQEGLNAKLREEIELRNRLQTYGLMYDKMGPAQKKVVELEEHLNRLRNDGADALVKQKIADTEALLVIARKTAGIEVQNERTLEGLRADKQSLDQGQQKVKSLNEEAAAMERKVATFGMAKGAVEALELAETKAALAGLQAIPEDLVTQHVKDRIEVLKQEVEARERIAAASGQLGQLESQLEFDKLMDPKKAEKFGDALANGFGKSAAALGKLINSFDKYEARMSKVKKAWEIVNKETDPIKRAKMTEQAADMEAESRIASYADMAGAAKGFFEEGSKGYAAMEAAEKAFRLFQMAMQLKSFLQEMGFISATTTASVVSDAAKTDSAVAGAATEIGVKMAVGQANAVAGVANQANGDPYSAFPRMAAMAAIMAALGFAVMGAAGGGGSKNVAAERQASQGTGTVLGDSSAKSESISKSMEILSNNSDISLRYSAGMLSSLQNIEYSLVGATNGVLRDRGTLTGSDFEGSKRQGATWAQSYMLGGVGGLLDKMAGGFISSLLGFGASTSLKDSGLIGRDQTVGDIQNNGFGLNSYQDVQTKKKAFYVTYSDKTRRTTGEVDEGIKKEFGNVINGMVHTLAQAGETLGMSAESITKQLAQAHVNIGMISLKGLTGDEIQKQLEAVFSGVGDKLTKLAIPAVERFQKSGEGLMQTAVRVASGVETAGFELEKLGIHAVKFYDVVDAYGDVGAEIVRQSILAEESGSGIAEIISTLTGQAADLASTYKSLVNVRNSLSLLGIANDVNRDLIRAAGGLETLQDSLSAYNDNFFSDSEQSAMKLAVLRKEFDKMNIALPSSKTAFRELIDSLSASGTAGQELAVKVLQLSGSFADVADFYENEYKDKLTAAHDKLSDAYERESQALSDTRDKFKDFSSSLGEFKDQLLLGDTSPLSAADKYNLQRSKFDSTLAQAQSGNESAIGNFQTVAQDFLAASKEYNASGAAFQNDFERVVAGTTDLQKFTDSVVSDSQKQLDAMTQQVSGLITVNESVLSVRDAITAMTAIIAAGSAGLSGIVSPTINGSHANGLDFVPFDGYIAELHKGEAVLTASEARAYQSDNGVRSSDALVSEIKSLREQVAALRDGQREQTGQLIAATYDSNERNAQSIVEGQKDAASSSTYSEKAKVTLA